MDPVFLLIDYTKLFFRGLHVRNDNGIYLPAEINWKEGEEDGE